MDVWNILETKAKSMDCFSPSLQSTSMHNILLTEANRWISFLHCYTQSLSVQNIF
eukprot:c46202_g1_i1 orf=10-174(-)